MAKDKAKSSTNLKKQSATQGKGSKPKESGKKGQEKAGPLDASDLSYLVSLKTPKPPAHSAPADMHTHFTPGVRSFLERKAVLDFLGKRSGVEKVGRLAEEARRSEGLKAKLTDATVLVTAVGAAASTGLYDIASSLNDARADLLEEFGDDTEQLRALFDWWDEFHARTKPPKGPPPAP
jgi:hypothetical protein